MEEGRGPGLPGSLAAAVQASQQESREARPPGGPTPGEGEATAAAVAGMIQVAGSEGLPRVEGRSLEEHQEEAEGSLQEGQNLNSEAWTEVVKRGRKQEVQQEGQEEDQEFLTEGGEEELNRSLARLREGRRKTSTPLRKVLEVRDGDWRCKDEKCAYTNFAWRQVCMRCQKDRQGVLGLEPSREQGASRGNTQVRRDNALRHPNLIILSINLIKDGKSGQKPRMEDHVNIMRQAGLNLDEVRGKVGKNGYLEVALEHGAESAVRALREASKEVDNRYTISSVREQGASREVTIRWGGVPFSVQDETLYSYLEQFSKPVRQIRNLWWVKDEPGEGLRGVWNAERTLVVHLNPGVGHVPVWHYVGGAKMKLLVPGKRSCPRCMKPVGDCRGGGAWGPCEETGVERGDWKREQERFLKNVGSSLEMQKALERELMEVEKGPEDPEIVAEMRAEAERLEADAQAKEVLVYRVPPGKICGGVRLQGFPECMGNRKTEKKEAILTIIELCNDLSKEEEERLGRANVEVSRPERGKKGTVEVKVMLNDADALLRKVWSQLEVPCREEGVKRYMVEASTQMSPGKEKQKTALQKARNRVGEYLKEEEERNKKVEEEKRNATENTREEEEVVPAHGSQLPLGMELHEGNVDKVVESLHLPVVGEQPPVGSREVQKPTVKETGSVEMPVLEDYDSAEMSEGETVEKTAPGKRHGSEKAKDDEGSSKELPASETGQGDAMHLVKADLQKQGEDKTVGNPVTANGQDNVRVKA